MMTENSMSDRILPRRWLDRLRVRLRTLMIIVLLLGGGLGWLAHLTRQAQIQRDAVAAVMNVGGSVLYDWQFERGEVRVKPGTNAISNEVPGWPKWMVGQFGVDAFGVVTDVTVRRSATNPSSAQFEEVLAHIGNLNGLKNLGLVPPVNDAGLAHLETLVNLESLNLRGGFEVTDAGVTHLARMTSLKVLCLENSQISDGGLTYLRELTALETLSLAHTHIGDAGLAHLDRMNSPGNFGAGWYQRHRRWTCPPAHRPDRNEGSLSQ